MSKTADGVNMTAIPGPLQSMVFRSDDLPALFHHTDAIAIARQREAVNTTRGQLILLVVGAVPAALPWHGRVGGSFQLLDAIGALAYLGVLVTTYAASRRKAKSHWQLNRSAAEFIKSMCWRYAVHGSPFDTGTQHPEAVFANRLEEGLQELRKVGWVDPGTRWAMPAAGSSRSPCGSYGAGRSRCARRPTYGTG